MSSRAVVVPAGYLLLALFASFGDRWSAHHQVVFPIYGIALTLPWSAAAFVAPKLGLMSLKIGAVLNALILSGLLSRRRRAREADASDPR